ncbi:MAG: thiamine-phosphate diphosphorylase [Candidatus Melainabacteria bacterium RIFOXYA12_FULL_32_12]|nr:MAG: thiamine-phosphate diphosphorylase [Candidatus Melainabacteria bacterium RIFOXYA2_FULL_32_9]OGI28742.1 MAG: thiamine-phosphate diphosphorylase [Candidatus Melainabacteria bacterium RIFOXYA12_FULL_32_12]
MNRIIDANLNRATEALRAIEEISRFYLDNKILSEKLKFLRHQLANIIDENYKNLLNSRNTQEDVGIDIKNPTQKVDIWDIYKANFKRLQQSLRVLAEFAQAEGLNIQLFENARYDSYTLEKTMFEELSKKLKKRKLQDKKLYLVTDRNQFSSQDEFLDAIAAALKGGVQIIQLREKCANAKEFIELGRKVKELCSLYEALFIINDRVDIAHIIGADGVHLGQDDIDIDSARHLLGQDAIVGLSTHSPEQAQSAIQSGADYIGVGPVFTTPTKPGRKAVGLEYVEWASENTDIPWFAIGGINLDNVDEVLDAGALRIAVVRAIINADNPEKAASQFLEKLILKEHQHL